MTCDVPHRAHGAGNLDAETGGGIDLVAGLTDTPDAGSVWLDAGLTGRTDLLQAAVEALVPFLVRGTLGTDALPGCGIDCLAAWALGSAKGERGEGDK